MRKDLPHPGSQGEEDRKPEVWWGAHIFPDLEVKGLRSPPGSHG